MSAHLSPLLSYSVDGVRCNDPSVLRSGVTGRRPQGKRLRSRIERGCKGPEKVGQGPRVRGGKRRSSSSLSRPRGRVRGGAGRGSEIRPRPRSAPSGPGRAWRSASATTAATVVAGSSTPRAPPTTTTTSAASATTATRSGRAGSIAEEADTRGPVGVRPRRRGFGGSTLWRLQGHICPRWSGGAEGRERGRRLATLARIAEKGEGSTRNLELRVGRKT